MKWANRKERLVAIARVTGYAFVSIAVVVAWVLFYQKIPSELPRRIELNLGKSVMKNYPNYEKEELAANTVITPIDSMISEMNFKYILDVLHQNDGQLRIGDLLIQIAVGKSANYWQELFNQVQMLDTGRFWKEASGSIGKRYRILYIGPFRSEKTMGEFLQNHNLQQSDVRIKQLAIEKIVYYDISDNSLVMTYDGSLKE